jgi:hypothetical protein
MRFAGLALVAALGLLATSMTARGTVVLSDGFESYTAGGAPLDKNVAGPNQAPNGSGNPWFGPAPPNARVVGTENGVVPFAGSNMIRGSAPSDFDENWVNLQSRFNGGQPYTGGIQLDFHFYDPDGTNADSGNYRDFGALGYYDTAPTDSDYPGTGSLNSGVVNIQRLCLGASSDTAGSYDSTKYQVRVVGRTDGYDGATGWFNTSVTRSAGWHLGRIAIGPDLGDGTNNVDFYIDDTTTPAFSSNSITNFGYNVIEMNLNYGATNGYFDNVAFSTADVPEPVCAAGTILIGVVVAMRRRRSR